MVETMVTDFAQELARMLAEERIVLRDESGAFRVPKVYAHALPPPKAKERTLRVPWVLVSLYSGEQSSAADPRVATLHITDMVFSDQEDMQGGQDAMQLLDRICWRLYSGSFVAGKYEVVYPVQFAMLDDVKFPYFAAGLAVKVQMSGIAPQTPIGGYAYV